MDQFDLSGLNAQLERTVRLLSQAEQSSSHIASNLSGGGAGGGSGPSNITNLSGMFGTWSSQGSATGGIIGGAVGILTENPALGNAATNVVNGGRQLSLNMMSAYLGALPSQQSVFSRGASYYRGTLYQGGGQGMNAAMQSATMDAFKGGGMTYAGADADVYRYLSSRGMVAGSSTYLDTVRSVAAAGKYLNMDNMTAATAFEGMTSGSMSSNLLSLGIMTSDSRGRARSTSDIFNDIYQRMTTGRPQASVKQTLESLRRGGLGASLNNLGFSDAQKELFQQFAIAKAKGQTLDFSNQGQLESLVGQQISEGNRNPQAGLQQINYQNTRVMKEVQDSYINGLEGAIPAIKTFTDAMINYGKVGGEAMAALQQGLNALNSSSGGSAALNLANAINNGEGIIPKSLQGVVGDMAAVAGLPAMMTAFGTAIVDLFNPETWTSNTRAPKNAGGPSNGNTLGQLTGTGGPDGSGRTGSGGKSSVSIGRPVAGPVTSGYGPRKHPITGENKTHNGIDIQASEGTAVHAAADGTVSYIGHDMSKTSGYGNYVTLDHDNGYQTRYAHLSKVSVHHGQHVLKGEKIGEVGQTGAATGPHLHFEVEKNGSFIDPSTVMGKKVTSTPSNNTTSSQDTRPAWMQAGAELVAGRLGNSGYLPIEQSTSATTPLSTPSPLSGGTASGKSGSGPAMGDGKAMLTLPKNRSFLDIDSLQTHYLGDRSSGVPSSHSGGGGKNNVTINVTIAQSTPAEAQKLAEMVKGYLEEDSHIGMIRRR